MKKPEVYLIGNNLAVLVAACELGEKGYQVKLFTDSGILGGIFSGIRLDNYNFDLGMFLFEQIENENSNPRIHTHQRSSINSWLSESKKISSWLNRHIKLKKVLTPEVFLGGEKYPDYIMANRTDSFSQFNICPPVDISNDNPYHASHKEYGEIYNNLTYAESVQYNHGDAFQAHFIEPFLDKIIAHGSNEFLAKYHRFSWAPLYYPETINAAIKGEDTGLSEYFFWTTKNGFIGDLVKKLKNIIVQLPNVEIIDKKLTSINLTQKNLIIDDNVFILENKVSFGLSLERLHELLGTNLRINAEGIPFTLAIALVKNSAIKDKIGCLFIVDDISASYRITDQDALAQLDPTWHRIVIESNSNVLKTKYPLTTLDNAMMLEIKTLMGIEDNNSIKVLKILNIENGLYLPSKKFIDHKTELINIILEKTNNSILTGDLLGYGTSSINNQIMQGLNIMEQIK
jgi:hypothetical protein